MVKKAIYVFVFGMIVLLGIAAADPLLVVDYSVCKNGSVLINGIGYANGTAKIYEAANNDGYRLEISGKNKEAIVTFYFPVSFYVLSDPPTEVNCSLGYQRLPWENDSKYIGFYHGDKLLKKIDISDYVCKINNLCESNLGENYVNCPQDCPREIAKPKPNFSLLFAGVLAAVILILVYLRRKAQT